MARAERAPLDEIHGVCSPGLRTPRCRAPGRCPAPELRRMLLPTNLHGTRTTAGGGERLRRIPRGHLDPGVLSRAGLGGLSGKDCRVLQAFPGAVPTLRGMSRCR